MPGIANASRQINAPDLSQGTLNRSEELKLELELGTGAMNGSNDSKPHVRLRIAATDGRQFKAPGGLTALTYSGLRSAPSL
jgi:hypothetical protein